MNLHLQDKHVLITGGSKGIGLACASAFLQEGAHVTLLARNADILVAAQRELRLTAPAGCRVHVVAADLTDASAAAAALSRAEDWAGPAKNACCRSQTAGLARGQPGSSAGQGVRVNSVNPGSTLTQRLENAIASDAKSRLISLEAALAQLTEKLPMGRIARPEEVAHAVVFLASSQASYINGANLAIDGALVPLI